jgi:hypothetical protein
MRGLLNTLKIALMLAVLSLAIVTSLFVLDVFTTEVAREILTKLMKLFGIWTGVALVGFIISLISIKKNS